MASPRPDTAHDRRPALVLLGGSVRALAESAHRAGFAVHAADLFCDLDTIACARRAVVVAGDAPASEPYPWSLRAVAAGFPREAAWCYSGALENHPALIAAIASERRLAGTGADAVRRIRCPRRLAAAARAAGLRVPVTLPSPAGVPQDGSFLVKPRHGAGGRGIRRWTAAAARAAAPAREPLLWQEFVPGQPVSVAYMMQAGDARLLGASRQFIGCHWCRATEFSWCGGVATRPGTSADPCRSLLEPLARLGAELAARFRPCGAVGVDCIATADGRLLVLEVNPRPTASMELHERLGAGSIAGLHVAAGDTRARDRPASTGDHSPGMTSQSGPAAWAKAILFATAPTPITENLVTTIGALRDAWTVADGGWPAISDLPRPDQVIAGRAPVLTVFAAGDTADEAEAMLRRRVAAVAQLLPDDPGQPAIRRGTAPLAAGATKCIR